MIYSVDAQVTAPVYDTEVTDRVADAIVAIFPGGDPAFAHGEVTATIHDLEHFSELLYRQQILDTAREVFFENRRDDTFSFQLKKAAAFEGVVNFVADEPGELGAITARVRVEEPSVEEYVDHVTPPTEGGEPIES